MFVGEAPGFHEDKQGDSVRRAGRASSSRSCWPGSGSTRGRRLHRQRAQVPAAGQPRPGSGRDRGLRGPSLPPDRADPAAGRRDPRQLRDEAPVGQAGRHHARSRRGAGRDSRRQPRAALPALPPGRRALHARDAEGARGGLRAAARDPRPAGGRGRARRRSPRLRSPSEPDRSSSASSEPLEVRAPPRRRRPRRSRPPRRASFASATSSPSRASSGAGKTTFVRGACRALGVTVPVTSPTYTVGHRYRADPTCRTSISSVSRASRPPSGAISSRTSRTRSASSSGPRRPPVRSRRSGSRYVCATWIRLERQIALDSPDNALLDQLFGADTRV